MKDFLKTVRKELNHSISEALKLNENLASEFERYHEMGSDRDSLANLSGIFHQPWFLVMQQQVRLVYAAQVSLFDCRDRMRDNIDYEEIHTTLCSIRICSPSMINSSRTSHVAISNKRKQFSELLPYVRSQ